MSFIELVEVFTISRRFAARVSCESSGGGMNKSSLLIVIIVLLSSCGHTYRINRLNSTSDSYRRLDVAGPVCSGKVLTMDGKTIAGSNFIFVQDTVQFMNKENKTCEKILISDIKEICLMNRRAGFAGGFLIGLFSSGALSLMLIDTSAEMAGFGVIVYSALGGISGMVIGAIKCEEEKYIFNGNIKK
jgi:hypothetical protein